jgi:hypothetical protein
MARLAPTPPGLHQGNSHNGDQQQLDTRNTLKFAKSVPVCRDPGHNAAGQQPNTQHPQSHIEKETPPEDLIMPGLCRMSRLSLHQLNYLSYYPRLGCRESAGHQKQHGKRL